MAIYPKYPKCTKIQPIYIPDWTSNLDGTMNEPAMRQFLLSIGIPADELDGIITKLTMFKTADYSVYGDEPGLNAPNNLMGPPNYE